MNITQGLNTQQKEAVMSTEGPLLILAGAGSGKTKTIIHRIAYIIDQKLAYPSQILAITFTNKAAEEMRNRISSMNIKDSRNIWMYTFHAMCARILRMYAEFLGYNKNFVIYDTDDQKRLYKQVMKSLNFSDKFFPFASVIGEISLAKENTLLPKQYEKEVSGDFRKEKIAQFYKLYQAELKNNNAMDFDDLILNTIILFKTNPQILQNYQNKFKYILVDEYQDTNHNQYELVHMLSGNRQNICVCGDDDQSIYGWRGADIHNILNFEKDYPGAKIIKLEKNYRSTPSILNVANHVISFNKERKEKNLWTDNPDDPHKIALRSFETGNEEAEYISNKIKELKENDHYKYNDIAILYRTNAQSRLFEESFMRNKISYQLIGGTNFYSRQEIKDIIAYLHILYNPQDNLDAMRIINVPRRGIGNMTIQKLQDFADFKGYSFLDSVFHCDENPELSKNAREKVKEFSNLLNYLMSQSECVGVSELIQEVIDKSGYIEMLKIGKTQNAEARIENIRELISSAVEFENNSDDTSLRAYLETVSLTSDTDKYDENNGKVLLMTLHNAKGLEFPVVFMPGMEDGIFPHIRSFDNDSQMEEERRICYVGITRAQKRLFLTYAKSRTIYGRTQPELPSRFLKELPKESIDYIEPIYSTNHSHHTENRSNQYQAFTKSLKYNKHHTVKTSSQSSSAFHPADKVKHKKFGIGTIIDVQKNQISVAFPGIGIKKLSPSYVQLVSE
jgi:DNA helicase-2/ATP-dependent DNA helicase PcrA